MKNQTIMGILSYLGPLVAVSYFFEKDDQFVKFHVKQGIVLLIIEVLLWLTMTIFWPLTPVIGLLQLGVLILAIIGIMNVAQNQEKELPIVGSFAKHVKI